jgi:aspartokinase
MPDERTMQSEARALEIAERAAAKALSDTFRLLGFDMAQMDDVNALRDDFRFIRQQRSNAETRRSEVFKSATSAVVGGFIGMLLSALTWLISVLRHQS